MVVTLSNSPVVQASRSKHLEYADCVNKNFGKETYTTKDFDGITQQWRSISNLGKGAFSRVILVANMKEQPPKNKYVIKLLDSNSATSIRKELEHEVKVLKVRSSSHLFSDTFFFFFFF